QPIPRSEYVRHLPSSASRIIAQAGASAALHLYGDIGSPDYVDRDPIDGVDDRRARRLLAIAERFSPILRRNSFVVPRDVWWVVGDQPLLQLDRWSDDRLIDSSSFNMEARPSVTVPRSGAEDLHLPTARDARLAALVKEFDPSRMESAAILPGARQSAILFIDTPGHDAGTWRDAYKKRGSAGSKIHAHFFVHEDPLAPAQRRFMLVTQYWFFYPFNDGGNNHEGDWEHINVLITTRASAIDTTDGPARAGYTSAAGVGAMLDGTTPLEQLVIGKVDYYFHHNVLTMDYRSALAPHDRHPREPLSDSASAIWEDQGFLRDVVHARLEAHGGRLATHPVGYIGGNNKGPDELGHLIPLFGRSYNRTSGATYPFFGTWQTIGPLGATESVWGSVVPNLKKRATPDSGGSELADVEGADYLTYRAADIVLLPDWERVLPLVRSDLFVAREWAWILLPIRWGYPATKSPGAGVMAHVDLGNVAPFGPAFKMSWNVIGADRDHPDYQFRALRTPFSPRVPWSLLQSGWGILNVPLVLTQVYPFYNMAGAHLSPLSLRLAGGIGVHFPKTFVATPLERIASVATGVSHQFGGDGYARAMLPLAARHNDRLARLDSAGMLSDARVSMTSMTAPRYLLDLHMGKQLFLENSLTLGESRLRYAATDRTTGDDIAVDGTIRLRQLTGGLRKILPWQHAPNRQLFGRLGSGWAWYRIRDVTAGDSAFREEVKGGYAPTLLPSRRSWPNFVYTGVAYEYFSPRSKWFAKRLGYGFRVDANWIVQRMPAGEIAARQDLWMSRGDFGLKAMIGW
ncbi:MAG: hypothetical protein ABIW79_07310, partial [Gemmatimonas sp.]